MDLIKKDKKKFIVNNQITKINDTITKIKNQLFIALVAYDEYYKKYYTITLILFITSSLVTFIEALRLIIIEYINKNDQLVINEKLLTTLINVLVLSLGILITILSSVVRFKNYREILEKLREKQNIMIEYIDKYNKQKNNLEFLHLTKEDDIQIEEIEKIKNDIAKYDTILVSTNILQFLTTKDLIRYNKYKKKFDIDKNDMILQYQKKLKDLKDKENAITLEDKKILKMLKDEENAITLEDKKILKMLKDEENNLQKEIDEENNGNCFKFLNF
jgi:uncharacterized protein YifE (UPF0438 family)